MKRIFYPSFGRKAYKITEKELGLVDLTLAGLSGRETVKKTGYL